MVELGGALRWLGYPVTVEAVFCSFALLERLWVKY